MTDIAQGASCACGPYKKEKTKFEKFMTSPWTKIGTGILCLASPAISLVVSFGTASQCFAKIFVEKIPVKRAVAIGAASTLFCIASGTMFHMTKSSLDHKQVFAGMESGLADKMLDTPTMLSASVEDSATYPRLLGLTWPKTGPVEMSVTGARGVEPMDNGCKPFRFTTSTGENYVAYYTRAQNGNAIKCSQQ